MYEGLRAKSLLFWSSFSQHLNRPYPGILQKIPKVKFHEKLEAESFQADTQTDRHEESNRHTDRQAWGVKQTHRPKGMRSQAVAIGYAKTPETNWLSVDNPCKKLWNGPIGLTDYLTVQPIWKSD